MNNNFDINILVNGNRCKQYYHQGKTYIEAKDSSEYELEIKNNTWNRILCVSSVDGINVLTGQTATEDDPGYVIGVNSPLRIKGWRHSNNEVGAFKFTTKNNSYAKNQGGTEAAQNCGVIGIKLYWEQLKITNNIFWNKNDYPWNQPMWGTSIGSGLLNTGCNNFPGAILGQSNSNLDNTIKCCNMVGDNYSTKTPDYQTYSNDEVPKFDMGSTWGQKLESKVVETDFEKGLIALSMDIYYASRQSLIDMGVPINKAQHVSFPQSFPGKYATPPSGWRG